MSEAVMLAYITLAGVFITGFVGPLVTGWISRRAVLATAMANKAAADLLQAEMKTLAANMDGHMTKIIAMSEQAARDAGEVGGRDKEIAAQENRKSRLAGMIQEVGAKVDAVQAVVTNGTKTTVRSDLAEIKESLAAVLPAVDVVDEKVTDIKAAVVPPTEE